MAMDGLSEQVGKKIRELALNLFDVHIITVDLLFLNQNTSWKRNVKVWIVLQDNR